MIYRLLYRLVLARVPAEPAHSVAVLCGALLQRAGPIRGLLRRLLRPDPSLRVQALGLTFPSPLGVAAGLDKNLTWFETLGALGFGFVEVGTVTASAQEGNERPRLFRIPQERALLNSMGFPNRGAEAAAARLRARTGQTIVGANLGKSKAAPLEEAVADYRASIRRLAPVADYVTLNVSSPNTPGLRSMQAVEQLEALAGGVREELRALSVSVPVLVKLSPDLGDDEIDAIADLALAHELDGIIAVNTTAGHPLATGRPGGISGAPLKARALEVLKRLRARTGDRLTLVSVGGIETAEDAWERVLAGATLVQAYTGFVYGGPLWPSRVNRGLARRVRESAAASIQEMVGATADPGRPGTVTAGERS